jgi:hypothetical protein
MMKSLLCKLSVSLLFPNRSINNITFVEGQNSNALLTLNLSSQINQTVTVNYTANGLEVNFF